MVKGVRQLTSDGYNTMAQKHATNSQHNFYAAVCSKLYQNVKFRNLFLNHQASRLCLIWNKPLTRGKLLFKLSCVNVNTSCETPSLSFRVNRVMTWVLLEFNPRIGSWLLIIWIGARGITVSAAILLYSLFFVLLHLDGLIFYNYFEVNPIFTF